MTPADLLRQIEASGARPVLLPSGRLRLEGADVDSWHPVIAQYRQELTEALRALADTAEAGR